MRAWNNDSKANSSSPASNHRKAGFGRGLELPELALIVSAAAARFRQLPGSHRKTYAKRRETGKE
jgi:hypothetical protein